jgi:hypothetical protein
VQNDGHTDRYDEANGRVAQNGGGHAVAQWLRHCATNRKVAGSIPDSVIGIFH